MFLSLIYTLVSISERVTKAPHFPQCESEMNVCRLLGSFAPCIWPYNWLTDGAVA